MWPCRSRDSKICCISRMNWLNEPIFAYWYKFKKAKSCLNNYWVDMVKNGQDLIYHGTLKSESHKWFDELSRLVELFFHAGSDWRNDFWFNSQSPLYLWHLNAEGPRQMYIAAFFRQNSFWAKTTKNEQKWPKNKVFPLFWKILPLIFTVNVLK